MSETRSLRISRRTLARTGITAAAGLAAIQTGVGRTHAKQDGEVTFMNWDAVPGTPLEMALNMFQEETGISVNVQPAPTEDYTTKMRTLLASGSPPDVMRIDDDLVRGFAEANQLLDLGEMLEGSNINTDEFTEPLFTFPIQADDSRPAWVIGTQPRVFFYNVDMFEELGVPLPPSTWTAEGWTWDDFLETAKQLTDASEQRWGALIYGDNAYEQTFSVNNGVEGGIYSPDGAEFTLATDKGVEAVQWVTDLTCVHEVQPPWSQLQQDQAANQLFAAGRIGMMFSPLGFTAYLRENVSDFTWDVAPVPAKVDQTQEGSLIVFCIPQDAANPEAAWQLLEFLGGPEAGQIFAETGYFVPVWAEAGAALQPGEEPPAHIDLFAEAARHNTVVSTNAVGQGLARQIYRPELDRVFNCEASAEEVLT
jgi:multiple sugar transport system substrate-binding protein